MLLMNHPEYMNQEDFRTRAAKLEEIRALGVDPYPAKFTPSDESADLLKKFETKEVGSYEDAAEGKGQAASVAGRLVLFRAMGKNVFAHIQDMSGRIQVMFNRDHTTVTGFSGTPELSPIKFIEKKIDLGDIIG
ncbi:MAG TPA: OB-fold nucleic acid binding domain-containing protein, partial [Rhabdochlamydiaceae bacterium]|nr:OB-fold nucleic acid binding domain-containing protein [Rhabdochlamydiaceae bacterium]